MPVDMVGKRPPSWDSQLQRLLLRFAILTKSILQAHPWNSWPRRKSQSSTTRRLRIPVLQQPQHAHSAHKGNSRGRSHSHHTICLHFLRVRAMFTQRIFQNLRCRVYADQPCLVNLLPTTMEDTRLIGFALKSGHGQTCTFAAVDFSTRTMKPRRNC